MGNCCRLGFCFADISLIAGRAYGVYIFQTCAAAEEIQLIYGEGSQFLKGMHGVLGGYLLHQLCLACGYAMLLRQSIQLLVCGDILAEYGPFKGIRLQQGIYLFAEPALKLGPLCGIVVVYAEEYGICHVIDIAVAKH